MQMQSGYVIIWLSMLGVSTFMSIIDKDNFSIFGAMILGSWLLLIINILVKIFDTTDIKISNYIKLPKLKCFNKGIFRKRLEISIRIIDKDNSKIIF